MIRHHCDICDRQAPDEKRFSLSPAPAYSPIMFDGPSQPPIEICLACVSTQQNEALHKAMRHQRRIWDEQQRVFAEQNAAQHAALNRVGYTRAEPSE